MNVYEKLCEIQSELKVPKNQYNSFGNYSYRNCEDIQNAVKPILRNINAVLIVGDEMIQSGDRYYIKAVARLIDCETGEIIENTAYAREELSKKGMDAAQITGSTSSYARKYALNGLFCIDDNKDPDDASKGLAETQKEEKKALTGDIENLLKELARTGIGVNQILANYNVSKIKDMTSPQVKDAMFVLANKPDKPLPLPIPNEQMKEITDGVDHMENDDLPWNVGEEDV